jgi:hypothetical protein
VWLSRIPTLPHSCCTVRLNIARTEGEGRSPQEPGPCLPESVAFRKPMLWNGPTIRDTASAARKGGRLASFVPNPIRKFYA